ncbi:MAG: hypothetical protein IT531_13435 [Burkholderiales bacterium]|nr:hypothetical protein [Burkholderiales bacterium]
MPAEASRRPRVDPRSWRLPPLETYPAVVVFAQSIPGKLVLFVAFAALMKLHAHAGWVGGQGMWAALTLSAALVSIAGPYRHHVLLACAGLLLARYPTWFDFSAVETVLRQEYLYGALHVGTLRALTLIGCVPSAILLIHLARLCRDHPLGRTPVLWQHAVYASLLALAASGVLDDHLQVAAWSLLSVWSAYFWYLAYALMNQRQRQPAPMVLHLATFNPFAWATVVPMGKGGANWRSVEAAAAEELAVTQLKALKLLVWALFLSGVLSAFRWCVYEQFGVPDLKLAFDRFLQGKDVPAPLGLFSVLANLPDRLLLMAIMGHIIIALARLAGFRLLRNTYRPLSARTVAEFWNRYVYYFKEILVHVYFYPTFVRCFKRHPRLRIAFATFMAAGVGNFLFHFVMQTPTIAKYGIWDAVVRMQTYAFYCGLLAAGIIVSQLRVRRGGAGSGWVRRQLVPSIVVTGFFCFLSFFDGPQRHVSLARHFEFLLQSIGISYRF